MNRPLSDRTRARVVGAARRRVGIDARSLAAFRIALGLLLVADLLLRSRDLVAHYTDFGVLPRAALESQFAAPYHFSLHALSGDAWFQVLLFAVAAAFAAALAVGYRTTAVTVVSWVLLISLQNRNPVVLNGGDVLLRMLLFWAMFLPLGERWSIDARRADRRRDRVVGVATAALLLQIVIMYGVNAAMKLVGDLWRRGVAIEYVFSLDQFTVLFGDALAQYPRLLHALDLLWMTMLALSFGLILLTGRRRAVFVAAFVGAHLGMLLTMQLGLFPLVAVGALLPFLPGVVWDASLPRLAPFLRRVGVDRAMATLDDALPAATPRGVSPRLARLQRRLTPSVAAAFLVLVVLLNLQPAAVAADVGYDPVPDEADPVVQATRVDQYWNMFAPNPIQTDGWYVAPGRLENGSRVDALHGGPVRWDRPPDLADTYPNARWRKYLVNLWRRGNAEHRPYLGDYLCRRWNDRHGTEMVEVTLYYMEQPTRLDGEEPIERVELHRHRCPT